MIKGKVREQGQTLTREELNKWTAALRSGAYPQVEGMLCNTSDEGGYCCLGVLCEVLDDVELVECPLDPDHRGLPYREDFDIEGEGVVTIDYEAYDEVDAGGQDSIVLSTWMPSGLSISNLIELNDGEYDIDTKSTINQKTFAEIADFIEEKTAHVK